MANPASNGAAIRANLRDQPAEMPAMRILVARGAGAIFEAIARHVLEFAPADWFVAVGAFDRNVGAAQREP